MKLKTKYAAGMRDELEGILGCQVEVVEDRDAKYPCKMEYARNYGRDRHVVRVNPVRCVSEYPVFMMMLATKLQLRKTAEGELGVQQTVSSREEISRFEADVRCDRVGASLMARQGRNADGVINMLCGGLCTQCSSQIVELLAADVVLKDYPDAVEDMKRYLAAAAVEGAALSHEKLLAIYPEFVVTANRRLNLLFAMKCGEVCGKKLIDAYAPTPDEIDAALDLYGLYRSERDALLASGKIAGDVVARLMNELKVDVYAHLAVLEIAPVKSSPSADDGLTEEQRKALTDFYAHHGDGKGDAELMMLGLFKVLRELRGWPLEAVRTLAVEIAMLGAQGISPAKMYTLKSLRTVAKCMERKSWRTTMSHGRRPSRTRLTFLVCPTRQPTPRPCRCPSGLNDTSIYVVTPDHVEFGSAKSEPFSPEAKAALAELRQTLANC